MATNARASDLSTPGLEGTLQRLRDEVETTRELATLAAHAPDGLVRLTLDGHFTDLTPAVERILGWQPAVMCGRSITALGHPDDRPGIDARLIRILSASDHPSAEPHEERLVFRARRVDARYSWVEVILRMDVGPDGRGTGLVGSLRDVHERHETHLLERRRMSEQAALVRIAREALAGADDEDLADAAADELLHVLDARAVIVYGTEPGAGAAAPVGVAAREDITGAAAPALPVPLDADSAVALAISTGTPTAVEYADCRTEFGRGLALMWREGVAAPLIADGRTAGAVVAVYGYGEAPTPGTARVLAQAADLIGLALERR